MLKCTIFVNHVPHLFKKNQESFGVLSERFSRFVWNILGVLNYFKLCDQYVVNVGNVIVEEELVLILNRDYWNVAANFFLF